MMVTGLVGDSMLKSFGFRKTSFILGVVNLGSLFLFNSFDLQLKNQVEFNYGLMKIIFILLCYISLLIGIGGSSLLSQQILINSHDIYKEYILKQLRKKMNKIVNENKELENKGLENKESINEIEVIKDERPSIEDLKQNRIEANLENRQKNKFDYFFMICLITTFGYFGKYSINILLNAILIYYMGENYDKKLFFYNIIFLYGLSVLLSIILYSIFVCIFIKKKEMNQDKKNKYRLNQIFGYIIYSQNIDKNKGQNCCHLCCESTIRCCNEIGCRYCNKLVGEEDEEFPPFICYCCFCCYCCDYNEEDYEKKKDCFCYCYKAQRTSFWCNQYFTNKTQKKIIPYMIEYFMLQLITFAFEKQYEKSKGNHVHRKTFILVLVISFVLFFYFTISMNNIINYFDEAEDNDFYSRDEQINRAKHKEIVSALSNEILDGSRGVLFFNSLFSIIFSSFYLSKNEKLKQFFFENNVNFIFIPVLLNKFYYLTLNYYCSYASEEKKKKEFETISASTLISIYIGVWSFIIHFIQSIVPDDKNKILYIIQIIFSSIPSLVIIIFTIVVMFTTCPYFHRFLCCFLSYILCFGGLWNDYGVIRCCCCDNRSFCYCDCCYEACGECSFPDGFND